MIGSMSLHNEVWSNIQFVLIRVPSYVLGYGLARHIERGKKVTLCWVPCLVGMYIVSSRIPYVNLIYRGSILTIAVVLILCCIINISIRIFRPVAMLGLISYESYLTNVHFGYLLGIMTWKIGSIDLSYGNYLYYTAVIIIGLATAYIIHRISHNIMSAFYTREGKR